MPTRSYHKGYHHPKRPIAEIRKAKPKLVLLRGYTGQVKDLWWAIEQELKRRDWNWVTLARALHVKRQYLDEVTSRNEIADSLFYQICSVLDWTPSDYIERPEDGEGTAV